MNILWVAAVGLVALFSVGFLRRYAEEYAQFIPLIATLMLLAAVLPYLGEIISFVSFLGEQSGVSPSSLGLVLRGLGIVFVTRFASGICIDSGQRTLGETVEYCGQIAVISLALPLIFDLVQTITDTEF